MILYKHCTNNQRYMPEETAGSLCALNGSVLP